MPYARSKETINNILEAARSLFVDRDFASVTITDIAARAKVSTGALYHHFASKEDIYLQMIHHCMGEIRKNIDAVAHRGGGSYRERLHQSTVAFLQLPEELQPVLRLVRRDINIFADPMRRELIRAYQTAIPEPLEAVFRDAIREGELKPCDPRVLSWELVAMVEVALAPYSRSVIGGPEEISNFVLELLFDGVASDDEREKIGVQSGAA